MSEENRFNEPARMTFLESMRGLYETVKASAALGTQALASNELYESRVSVCETCDKLETVAFVKKCRQCGCIIHLKASAAASVCPLFKWPGNAQFKPKT